MPGIHFREVVCMLGIFGLFLQAAAGHILYLALHLESGSFPRPLPPDRERAAFADLQKGGAAAAQARDTLIRHNLRLVAHICKKYYAGNSAQDDMISIGTIGLIKAVDTFDPAKGKRFALPNAEIMIHQPLIAGGQGGGLSGQATDIKIHADHIVRIREKMNTLLSQYTGQPLDVITRDTERDNYMTAQQAKEYGLIDEVLSKREK